MHTFRFTTLLLAGTMLFAACGQKKKEAAAATDEAVSVSLINIASESFALPIVSTGIITSDQEARLSFKTGGIIASTAVREGDAVTKGQVLATLNLTEIEAQVTQARLGLEKATRDYNRVSALVAEGAATNELLQNAKTALDVAKETYQIATFNKDHSVIRATQTGVVLKKLMNEGEMAGPGMPIYVINAAGKGDWVAKVGLSDRDWARVKKGDRAAIQLDAYPGETITATVSEIAEVADPYSGTFEVQLKLQPGSLKIATGLVAKIEIQPSKRENLYLIPLEALTEAGKTSGYVYTVDASGKKAVKHKVDIAYILEDKVAVRGGLEAISTIVCGGAGFLVDGAEVIVKR